MKAKLHPADIADRALIAEAVEFSAFLRRGPFDKIVERAATLPEAAAKAEAIAAANNGRPALIYAILADGRSIPVPMDMRKSATIPTKETKTMTTTALSATDIAKLTATITGGGFKRSATKDAAVKRLGNALAEKIGEDRTAAALPQILAAPTRETAEAIIALETEDEAGYQAHTAAEADAIEAKADDKRRGARKAALAVVNAEKPAPKTKPAAEKKLTGKRAAILEAAQAGQLPPVPDFSAPTHARFRKKLDEVVALVKAGDLKGLKSFAINPVSSSPKAIARYRDLAVIALEAKKVAA